MDDVARNIGMDVEQFKRANLYKKGDISYLVSHRSREMNTINNVYFCYSHIHLMVKLYHTVTLMSSGNVSKMICNNKLSSTNRDNHFC